MKSKNILRVTLIFIAVICLLICLASAYFLFQYYRGIQRDKELINQVIDPERIVQDELSSGQSSETPETVEEAVELETVEIPVDFSQLGEVNPDIYAWLEIPGTTINDPILQHPTEQLFYNNHDIYGDYSIFGAVYSQSAYNSRDFDAPMTLIYGHNTVLYNSCAFVELNNYADAVYFDEHPVIYVYTPEAILVYRVFAAYVHSNEHLLANYDFSDPAIFEAYFQDIANDPGLYGAIVPELFPSPGDKVLTLSTCFSSNIQQRFLVSAVLQDTWEEGTIIEQEEE